jgi:hypothetical protein
MMRNAIVIAAAIQLGLIASCGNSDEEGKAAAAAQAAAEAKSNPPPPAGSGGAKPPDKMPVPQDVQLPCSQVIPDPSGFTSAIGEKDPLTVADQNSSHKSSTFSCALIRGGKRPSQAEIQAQLQKVRRLGTLPGDTVCAVTAYCSLLEEEKHFKERCKEQNDQDSDAIAGTYSCVHVVGQGVYDQYTYKFLDPDTRCVLEVRGGPQMMDNDLIARCAKAARDLIGPDQIKVAGRGK